MMNKETEKRNLPVAWDTWETCEQEKPCFANREGKCEILCDTHFEERDCPFFKTVEQFEADLRKYGAQIRLGLERQN